MSLGKNRKRINVKGGGTLQIRELSPNPTDTFSDIGYLVSSKLTDEHTIIELSDERGDFIDAKSGARKVHWETTLKQSGIDEINFLKNADGKYYEVFYSVKTGNDTMVQEISMCLCKIKPGPVLEFKSATERTIQVTIYALAPATTFTRTPSAYNVVAREPYLILEGLSATGVPSDTASSVASAIL
ncbi:MAG: hypothetical protein ACHQQQ_00075 [Bacteroidota bacterium]